MVTMIHYLRLIDSTIFLISEESFYDYFDENVDFLDKYTIPILISGISSAISILLAKMVTHYILKHKLNLPINEHGFYRLYRSYSRCNDSYMGLSFL